MLVLSKLNKSHYQLIISMLLFCNHFVDLLLFYLLLKAYNTKTSLKEFILSFFYLDFIISLSFLENKVVFGKHSMSVSDYIQKNETLMISFFLITEVKYRPAFSFVVTIRVVKKEMTRHFQ